MINTGYFKNKKVTIVGLARSGLSCANLLFELGADVNVTDNQNNNAVRFNVSQLKSKEIKVELGGHSIDFIKGSDFIIVSPGVPNDGLPIVWAKQLGAPVLSEIEVAWILCPAEIIAVTGSCGKTTVTTLVGKILEADGRRVFTCGNIGNPFTGELSKIESGDFVSLEVSSFQLENIKQFRPSISVILNFNRNHLDRYNDMQQYLNVKKRIFINQDKSDFIVLNQDDPVLSSLAQETQAQAVYFSEKHPFSLNQAAVLAVGSILGIEKEKISAVFENFKGIQHRMEFVAELKNVMFINDSKATTAESCIWALKNINRPVILIAGGKDKGVDYSLILDYAKGKVKEVILIGQAKEKIKSAFKDSLPIEEAASLEEAVDKSFSNAAAGDSVLLSPMCSSFDMFSSYEERGAVFKKIVWDLVKRYDA